jgi:hypothetical protein
MLVLGRVALGVGGDDVVSPVVQAKRPVQAGGRVGLGAGERAAVVVGQLAPQQIRPDIGEVRGGLLNRL